MMSTESIHRRLGLNNGNSDFAKRKEAPNKFPIEEEENDLVVPCITEDEEDEIALTTDQKPFQADGPAYNVIHEHAEEGANYGVETYLNHYEIMLQRQEDENVATLAHLKPMLEVLEALAQGRNDAVIPNSDTIYYDRTSLLKEFQLRDLQNAVNQLQVRRQFHFLQTDTQFMLVLKLLTEASSANTSQTVSWAEIAHCYKICVSGMQTLEDLPKGRIRNQARERTMSSLQLFRNDVPENITKNSRNKLQPSPSPLKSTRTRTTLRPRPEELECYKANMNEISFLKLIIAFLLGLTMTTIVISVIPRGFVSPGMTTSSIDLLLQQMRQNTNEVSETALFKNDFGASTSILPSSPPDTALGTSSSAIETSSIILGASPSELLVQPTSPAIQAPATEGLATLQSSTPKNNESPDSSAPQPLNENHDSFSPFSTSLSSNEKKALLSVAGVGIVGPAIVQAAIALPAVTSILPIGVAVVAATLMTQGVRDFLFGWLRRFQKVPIEDKADLYSNLF